MTYTKRTMLLGAVLVAGLLGCLALALLAPARQEPQPFNGMSAHQHAHEDAEIGDAPASLRSHAGPLAVDSAAAHWPGQEWCRHPGDGTQWVGDHHMHLLAQDWFRHLDGSIRHFHKEKYNHWPDSSGPHSDPRWIRCPRHIHN